MERNLTTLPEDFAARYPFKREQTIGGPKTPIRSASELHAPSSAESIPIDCKFAHLGSECVRVNTE